MKTVNSCLLLLLVCSLLRAEDAPTLRAKMGMPVVQELMGGCSLTCAFPWQAISPQSATKIEAVNDNNADTAWTAIRQGDKLTFTFPPNLPRELNGTPFYGIDFANGRIRPLANFKDFGRVKAVKLFHNNQPIYLIRLADTPRWQKVEFPDVLLNVGDTLALEIIEIYPGKKSPTAALTEIVLQGAH